MATVSASELAHRGGWDVKAIRDRLRDLEDDGHPICGRHKHNETWEFTEQDAQRLEAGAARRHPAPDQRRRG